MRQSADAAKTAGKELDTVTFTDQLTMIRKDMGTFYHLTNDHQKEMLRWAQQNDPVLFISIVFFLSKEENPDHKDPLDYTI